MDLTHNVKGDLSGINALVEYLLAGVSADTRWRIRVVEQNPNSKGSDSSTAQIFVVFLDNKARVIGQIDIGLCETIIHPKDTS